MTENKDKIIQVSGFGVENTNTTQCNYMIVGVTESGKVVISRGDGEWGDISPKESTKTTGAEEWCDCITPVKQWGSGLCLGCGKELRR